MTLTVPELPVCAWVALVSCGILGCMYVHLLRLITFRGFKNFTRKCKPVFAGLLGVFACWGFTLWYISEISWDFWDTPWPLVPVLLTIFFLVNSIAIALCPSVKRAGKT